MHASLQSVIRKGRYPKKGKRGNRGKCAGQIRVDVAGRRRGRIAMIGVIGSGGLHYFEFHDRGDAKTVEAFLTRAYEKLGKLLVYTDNASYHSESVFRKLYEKTDGGIVARFLPAYTPELAPIESQWREIKRHIANLFFDDVKEMKKAVTRGLKRGLIKIVKMHDCLTI